MKQKITLALIAFLTSASFFFSSAQNFNLYNTQEKLFSTKSVEDTFHIFISIPDNYADTDKKYPVLYVLDGDIAYGMAASIALKVNETILER